MATVIVLIICIVYIVNTNKDIENLRKENIQLKEKIKRLEHGDTVIEKNEVFYTNNEHVSSAQEEQFIKVEKAERVETNIISEEEKLRREKIQKEEKIRKEKERKNTNILITGAVLIVLAAIVFLTSTWTVIPDILKTATIILLVVVFLGASKIADEKFHLKKASATFYHIAMAYIPICLISCSLFGLLGGYLSIFGPGNFIYLTFTMVLTSCIYYASYKKRNSIGLMYASFISQVSSVILFSLIFENDLKLILMNLLIYNIALMILGNRKILEDLPFFDVLNKGIVYISSFLALVYICSEEYAFSIVAVCGLLVANSFLLYYKKENQLLNSYIFNTFLYVLGEYLIYSNILENNLRLALQVCYITIVFLLQGILLTKKENEKLLKASMVVAIIAMTGIYIESCSYNELILKPFVIAIAEEVLLLLAFYGSKETGKKILSYLIPSFFIIIGCDIINEVKQEYYLYILFAIATFVVGQLIRNDKLKKGFLIISHIFIGFTYVFAFASNANKLADDVVHFILLFAVHSYSFIKYSKVRFFKYMAYISGIICLYSSAIFLKLDMNVFLLIPLISTMIISVLEEKYELLKDEFSIVFKIFLQIMTYTSLANIKWEISKILFSLLFSAYLYYCNIKNEDAEAFRIIPILGMIPTLFYNNLSEENSTILKLAVVTALTAYSIYQKRISIDTVFSGIYLGLTINNFDNDYLKELLLIAWSAVHMYFMQTEKSKDLFKAIVYFGTFLLYNTFLEEFELVEYTAFKMIGITVWAIVFLKTILYKYVESIDNVEYVVLTLIYLTALMSYNDEKDGMIYVFAVVCILMMSYAKKYGAIFVVSMFAILVNALALTRTFWFSVPWWIYLLLIGMLLIGFAIKNESDDNKEKISVGKTIKRIKESIEKS